MYGTRAEGVGDGHCERLGDVVLSRVENSMTDGLVGVGGTSSTSGIHEKGTSLKLEPNSRMTFIMSEGAVASCFSYVRPRCESSTFLASSRVLH